MAKYLLSSNVTRNTPSYKKKDRYCNKENRSSGDFYDDENIRLFRSLKSNKKR